MRVKHNPYYLWSSYCSTFKRKTANFLIVEKGQSIKLKLTQKKRKKYRRKSTHSTFSKKSKSQSPHSLNTPHSNSIDFQSNHSESIDVSTMNQSQYHQYYTFDSIIIKEGGTLTIDTPEHSEINNEDLRDHR